jgi:thioredoxin 1
MNSPFSALIESETPVLVDFFAEWCGPCKMMKPVLEQVKKNIGESARIVKIDVDKNPQLSAIYQVQAVPTLILFRKGQVVWRQSGVPTPALLQSVILNNLK